MGTTMAESRFRYGIGLEYIGSQVGPFLRTRDGKNILITMLNGISRITANREQIYLDTLCSWQEFVRYCTLDTFANVGGSLPFGHSLGRMYGGRMLLGFR